MGGDGLVRWSQIVRRPATVQVLGWHETQVPALGGEAAGAPGRPGIRLQVAPVTPGLNAYLIDITSTAVIAMLEPFLRSGVLAGKLLSWESRGFGTRRRDTIKIKGVPS